MLAEPHHIGTGRDELRPGVVADVVGGEVALLVERVEAPNLQPVAVEWVTSRL